MVQTKYYRCDNIIRSVELNDTGHSLSRQQYNSTNQAKKESRRMQIVNGGLGAGYVKVLKRKKKPEVKKLSTYSNKYKKKFRN